LYRDFVRLVTTNLLNSGYGGDAACMLPSELSASVTSDFSDRPPPEVPDFASIIAVSGTINLASRVVRVPRELWIATRQPINWLSAMRSRYSSGAINSCCATVTFALHTKCNVCFQIAKSVVCGKIQYLTSFLHQLRCHLMGKTIRQREKNDFTAFGNCCWLYRFYPLVNDELAGVKIRKRFARTTHRLTNDFDPG